MCKLQRATMSSTCGQGAGMQQNVLLKHGFARCYVYASSLLSPQVIYAPVIMFSIQYFDPQCHVIPTANMPGRYFSPVFCHPKYIDVRHVCYT